MSKKSISNRSQNRSKNRSDDINKNIFAYCDMFTIFIISILLVIIIYYLYKQYKYYNVIKSNFEDTPEATGTPDQAMERALGGEKAPEMGPPKGCKTSNDLVGACSDYENCCNSAISKSCFCTHPLVSKCKTEYDNCMNDNDILTIYTKEQRAQKCQEQNKGCCVPYNSISIDSNKFQIPIKYDQKDNVLCNVPSINNINQKCMELCQTNPDCAGFSVNKLLCTLFSSISPITPYVDPFTKKPVVNTITDFYVKK